MPLKWQYVLTTAQGAFTHTSLRRQTRARQGLAVLRVAGGVAGTLVAPSVVAAYHQHLFCARLDMAVDDPEGGKGLVVSEGSRRLPLP